jgi:hypothetical protein
VDECKPLGAGAARAVRGGGAGCVRAAAGGGGGRGRAVQVDPVKPTLKAPGTEHLKLKHDKRLSIFAFKFNLRRYNAGGALGGVSPHHAATLLGQLDYNGFYLGRD